MKKINVQTNKNKQLIELKNKQMKADMNEQMKL